MYRRLAGRGLVTVVAYAISLTTLTPLYFLVSSAVKTNGEYDRRPLGFPTHVTLRNVATVWNQIGLGRDLLHSVIVSGGTTAVTVVLAMSAAYGLSQLIGVVARGVLVALVLCMMFTPAVLIIPLYVMMIHLKLSNTFEGAILAYTALFLPFGIFMGHSFLRELPGDVVEAARIDGAGPWRTFRYVVVPLSRPVITTLTVLLFVWVWNDLLYALILLQTPSTRTVMVGVTTLIGQYQTSYPELTAGLLVGLVPTLLVFLIFQRGLARGLTMGIGK